MSEFDTAGVRQSVMEALTKLDELKDSINALQAKIKSDFERKMELFRFSQVRREFLEPFFIWIEVFCPLPKTVRFFVGFDVPIPTKPSSTFRWPLSY